MKAALSDSIIQHAKKKLLEQQTTIEKQLRQLKTQDPYLEGTRDKIEEPATEAMEEEGHTRITANIRETQRMLSQVKKALAKIDAGSYGICEKCGNPIEEKRLEAYPMAILCLKCEKTSESKNR